MKKCVNLTGVRQVSTKLNDNLICCWGIKKSFANNLGICFCNHSFCYCWCKGKRRLNENDSPMLRRSEWFLLCFVSFFSPQSLDPRSWTAKSFQNQIFSWPLETPQILEKPRRLTPHRSVRGTACSANRHYFPITWNIPTYWNCGVRCAVCGALLNLPISENGKPIPFFSESILD